MLKGRKTEKGVVLFIVIVSILIVIILALAILSLVLSQSRLTQHQVGRIRAYYASKAMMNYALEQLRVGNWVPHATNDRYACHRGCIDIATGSADYTIPIDADIPYEVQVKISPLNQADNPVQDGVVTQLEIKTEYITSS